MIEFALLIYEFGFGQLGYKNAHFDVRKGNQCVIAFQQRFGARIVDEDELKYYFNYTLEDYLTIKQKYRRFLYYAPKDMSMSQLVLEIKNELVKERLLWLLQHFKKDELEILDQNFTENNQAWSDDYIEKNWKELIVTSSMQPDYEKSSQFREEFGEYLAEKNK